MQHNSLAQWASEVGSKAETTRGMVAAIRKHIASMRPLWTSAANSTAWGFRRARKETRVEYRARRRKERMERHIERARGMAGVGKEHLTSLADSMASTWPLRRAESRWAGGEHTVEVVLADTPNCICNLARVWSENGKWSGSNSHAKLAVTARAVVLFPALRTPDGGIVLDARLVAPREYEMVWVKQGRGTAIEPCRGWYVRGYHSTASTIEAARKEAARARKKTLTVRLRERQAKIVPTAVFVELADSLRAGNCAPISEQVAGAVWRGIGAVGPCAVRADVLLGFRDDVFSRRAVAAAATR